VGHSKNKQAIAESDLQGSVNVPELAGLSLGMEIDQKTQHAVLVNVQHSVTTAYRFLSIITACGVGFLHGALPLSRF
jgi:phosphate/sulfate permease